MSSWIVHSNSFSSSNKKLELLRRQAVQTQQQIELLEKDATFLKAQYQQIVAQMEQAKKFVDPVQLELPALGNSVFRAAAAD